MITRPDAPVGETAGGQQLELLLSRGLRIGMYRCRILGLVRYDVVVYPRPWACLPPRSVTELRSACPVETEAALIAMPVTIFLHTRLAA